MSNLYSLQVGSRLYFYCDTCGESYANQLDKLGTKDFVTLYNKRLHQKAENNKETSSQRDDTLLGQTTSEEANAPQDISQEMCNEVEHTLSADHNATGEHHVLQEHDGAQRTQGQDKAKEDLSQLQEHSASQRCDTQQVGNGLEQSKQDVSRQSSLENVVLKDCSAVNSTLDTAPVQDLEGTLTYTNSAPRQNTPAPLTLHDKRTNLNFPSQHPLAQVTESTINYSAPCNGHLASDTGNDSQSLETGANSTKSSGGSVIENNATVEISEGNIVTPDGRNQSEKPASHLRRKKPYDLDKLPNHHRVSQALRRGGEVGHLAHVTPSSIELNKKL